MIALQEEYRAYLVVVKKIVNEYNEAKEEQEQLSVDEKKKQVVASSEFVPVNRDTSYLKRKTEDFIKSQGQGAILKKIDPDSWKDYNQLLIDKQKKPVVRTRSKWAPQSSKTPHHLTKKYRFSPTEKPDIHFQWPIDQSKFWLSSFFGPRKNPSGKWGFHRGIDMAAIKGTPVVAAYEGEVVEANQAKGFGKTVVIAHNHKYRTRYAHLSKILVKVGQRVKQGELIGKVGDTGMVRSKHGRDPSHLHFEVYVFGKPVNPMYFVT